MHMQSTEATASVLLAIKDLNRHLARLCSVNVLSKSVTGDQMKARVAQDAYMALYMYLYDLSASNQRPFGLVRCHIDGKIQTQ